MNDVKRAASDLISMLETARRELINLADTMHQLHDFLDSGSKKIVQDGLEELFARVDTEVLRKITPGVYTLTFVLISPEGRISTTEIDGDVNSDPTLMRMKSEGCSVLSFMEFSSFIQSLKSRVSQGHLIPVIEFLRVNAETDTTPFSEPIGFFRLKPSDFLPAPFPHPPLPRFLFKGKR